MNTTPTWVTLVVAGLGLAATLGGVWMTQRRADKREAANWAKENEREQARWAREDAARTFEFRRGAYVDYYRAAYAIVILTAAYMGRVLRREAGMDDAEVAGRDAELQTALEAIQIYGTPRVLALAEKVQQGLLSSRLIISQMHVAQIDHAVRKQGDEYGTALAELHAAIREELGMPNDDSPDAEAWRSRWAKLFKLPT